MKVPPGVPDTDDVDDFLEQVNEVSVLIEGLKEGTITPEYVDRKRQLQEEKDQERKKHEEDKKAKAKEAAKLAGKQQQQHQTDPGTKQKEQGEEDAADAEEARQEEIKRKVQELIANRDRKIKARNKYNQYVNSSDKSKFQTDYTKWDLYCPEDEEDDLFNSMPPNTPQFRAMEKDIDERHKKMVEQRQLAERCRVKGNDAFKDKQYSDALRWYQTGIEAQKTNMALHANAAMAAIKLNCFVQAIEHCDKVLSIAEFLHENMRDPLCVKAYQRRATAYTALQQLGKAVKDLEAAADIEPSNSELTKQLAKTRRDYEEYRKQKQVKKAVARDAAAAGGEAAAAPGAALQGLDLEKLKQVESLVKVLLPAGGNQGSSGGSNNADGQGPAAAGGAAQQQQQQPATHGPSLPARHGKGNSQSNDSSASGAGRAAELADACTKLQGLLRDDDFCCIYFRECGGLQACANQIKSPEPCPAPSSAPSRAPFLLLLNSACVNDMNLERLPSLDILPSCITCIGSRDLEEGSASATLLCTAATNEGTRKAISKAMATPDSLQKLLGLLEKAPPAVQAVSLALLGNCMVDKAPKEAMQQLLQQPRVRDCFVQLMLSKNLVVASKACTLVGNMCGDAQLRQGLQDGQAIPSAALQLTCTAASASARASSASSGQQQQQQEAAQEVQVAAATALFNLVIDAPAQEAVASSSQYVNLAALLEPTAQPTLLARVTGVVSRVVRHTAGREATRQHGVVARLVGLLKSLLSAPGTEMDSDRAAVVDASVRTLAVYTAVDDVAAVNEVLAVQGLQALLQVLKDARLGESPLGNAALCIGAMAKHKEHLGLLRNADAVAALVKVAYDGKGNTASKNASIALARMAHDPHMLERLRELHGIEIIYQYVKP